MMLRRHLTTLGLLVAAGALVSPPPASAATSTQIFGQPVTVGDARQIVTVRSDRAGSSYATLTGWTFVSGKGWAKSFGPVPARVGAAGTTNSPSEGKSATPQGTYTLREAFGARYAPAGTRLPYRVFGSNDWWVSDAGSRYYNTWQVGPPNGRWNPAAGERLGTYATAYAHAVVIDFNRNPVVRGKGSAIFLHVGNGSATAGCVSISSTHLVKLLPYLDPALRPRIAIQ
jgi:L,D-peptidoglycan transpeptidase YkuD (ErfK/YbiS/YcfS/YnhG family)